MGQANMNSAASALIARRQRDQNRLQRRQQIAALVLPLYAQGLGHKTIAKHTGLSPRIVRTVLIEQGVYNPNPLRNGYARKGCRKAEKVKARMRKVIREMCVRVKRCLNLYDLLRRRMKKVIKEGVKAGKSLELVGCSTAHLRAHLERQFKLGITWENLGIGKGKWNVDHIMPCAAFDLTNPAQQRTCFHWTNLRPLWSSENIRKSDTITHPQLSLCL